MADSTETAFLRAIAETPDDDSPRLVFSDWLEENGEAARAEFIRVQCRLASGGLSETQTLELQLQEDDLLFDQRAGWIEATGLPLEDVRFERGFVTAARFSRTPAERLDDPQLRDLMLTVRELDLSGLGLDDDAIRDILDAAEAPLLQTLMLNDNRLTGSRLACLRDPDRFTALESVWLFGNPMDGAALGALKGDARLTIDFGEPKQGYSMSAGQTESARRAYVRAEVLPLAGEIFKRGPAIRSLAFCIAQFWNDEANDAVHNGLVVSERPRPRIEGSSDDDGPIAVDDSVVPGWYDPETYRTEVGYSQYRDWDSNGQAIPIWAAFAQEGGSQDEDFAANFGMAVVIHRHGGYEFEPMIRPQLDGIQHEWS